MKVHPVIAGGLIILFTGITWFSGWIIYDQFELWRSYNSQFYQSYLGVIICIGVLVLGLFFKILSFNHKEVAMLESEKKILSRFLEDPECEIDPFDKVPEWVKDLLPEEIS